MKWIIQMFQEETKSAEICEQQSYPLNFSSRHNKKDNVAESRVWGMEGGEGVGRVFKHNWLNLTAVFKVLLHYKGQGESRETYQYIINKVRAAVAQTRICDRKHYE